jgi:lipoprotein-releasing system ATP-binding protein
MSELHPRLKASDVSRRFEAGAVVLDGVNLEAGFGGVGETVAIVGPSGSGKSTLLNIIGALDKPTSGRVVVDGVEVTELNGDAAAEYRAKKVGFVFQDHHLLPQLTGVENVLLPTLAVKGNNQGRERAAELLERVGVSARAHAFPGELSGGERQRVAVARALINGPGILLCDEPTGNLDHDNAVKVVELFVELAKRENVVVVMVTHNLELAGRFGRCLRLSEGRLKTIQHEDTRSTKDHEGRN